MFCLCQAIVSEDGEEVVRCKRIGKVRKTRLLSPTLEKEEYHACEEHWQLLLESHKEVIQSN